MAATMFTMTCSLLKFRIFTDIVHLFSLVFKTISFVHFFWTWASAFLHSPSCDIFVAGFPCQPFSAGGTGLGRLDPRGTVVFRLITWISMHLPTVFVLENVLGLLERYSDTLYEILRLLVEIGSYEISWSILGANTHGNVPQHRQRIFICGILRSKLQTPLQWPSATPLSTQLADFIDQDGHVHEEVQWPSTKPHKRNLREAIERIITLARILLTITM